MRAARVQNSPVSVLCIFLNVKITFVSVFLAHLAQSAKVSFWDDPLSVVRRRRRRPAYLEPRQIQADRKIVTIWRKNCPLGESGVVPGILAHHDLTGEPGSPAGTRISVSYQNVCCGTLLYY